ncbi:MAG: glutamine--fructose-6-phosphate transaminase (isomerizing) [Candidatus Aminicenantes bacterium]|nr:MAG: glutamine--fructose-6-phosphate transaminase (isomerizing) [Candidatus Aminicenantes bacterium]
MCGIFGIIFKDFRDDLGKILLQAGRRLSYRGYDSVGMAAFDHGSVELRKDVGEIEEVNKKYNFETLKGNKGIVQLRWATFGPPSKQNSQPHFDCTKKIVGAHNGNIVNTRELIREYEARDHIFQGENDGEVVVHVVEESYKKRKDMNRAIQETDTTLKGDYAYVITEDNSDRMYCVKKYSSLFLGVGKDFICCSSDLPSIIQLTDSIVPIYDGEYIEYTWDSYKIRNLVTGEEVKRNPKRYPLDIEQAQKGEFPHFMLKEIHEQPERAQALIDFLIKSGQADEFCEERKDENRVYLIGSGSSYNACVLGAFYLNKIAGIEAIPIVAGSFKEFLGHGDLSQGVYILVSQSGETKDVVSVLNFLEKKNVEKILAVVNVLGSSLQLRVKKFLPLLSNIEISVPATKTFTNQVIIFLYLAMKLGRERANQNVILEKEFQKLPSFIRETLSLTSKKCQELAKKLAEKEHLNYLGYGISFGACLEAALKMKEITYIPCEGMYSSEFKHGPLAIIKKGDWILFLTTLEDSYMTLSHINEVSCRWGKICTIAPPNDSLSLNSDELIPLPSQNYFLIPLLAVVVSQQIAYYVSQEKGINPDQPRNISKTLTVD